MHLSQSGLCNSKMAQCKVKRSEIWDSGLGVLCIWDIFDLLVLNIILGSLRPFCTRLKMACNSKMAGHLAKRSKISVLGIFVICIESDLTF